MGKSVPETIQKPDIVNTFEFTDKTIIKLLEDKEVAVKEGRAISIEIEEVQKRIDELTEEEMKLTEKVEPEELVKRGNEIRDKVNELIKQLEEVANDIKKEKLAAIPKEIQDEHLKLNDKREKLEQKRNKKALKVQKIKDRLIPKLHAKTEGKLNEYEDLLSAELKDGKCVIEVFNHLEEWKRQFALKTNPPEETKDK